MAAIATATTLRLNGFRLEPSTESFTAYRAPMPADGDLRELRRSLESTWTIYREDDEILAVPRTDPPATEFGEAAELRCHDHLGFLSFLINDALPRAISSYPASSCGRSPLAALPGKNTWRTELIVAGSPGRGDVILWDFAPSIGALSARTSGKGKAAPREAAQIVIVRKERPRMRPIRVPAADLER